MNGLPTVRRQTRDAERSELELLVDADNPWFQGHFPQFAILPGVVQIGWAEHYARTLYGLEPGIAALEQVKFKRPILPGAELLLILKPDLGARKIRYEYRDAEMSYSSGILSFVGAA
ncbi:MAG TPA: hydroxymyristoyl-ACP dehydratase [Gammaproteobacteria bacterium]|nr:hydroxymyristoyl-ACP dehydratase [Gammaproteobacteria bacterium]